MAKEGFNPGGSKGKLHRELHVPVGKKMPPAKLKAATHSKDREVRDDAIRAETMIHKWHHVGRKRAETGKRGHPGMINRG
ncbi:MAG: hypothetical protein KGL39_46015 [Patescibacteria group bacterium]|nr:hypothetical protein [Patescibacteria group bacterium]